MVRMKYTLLISALAAASLFAAGCEQRPASSDKVGQAKSPTSNSAMNNPSNSATGADSSSKPALTAQNGSATQTNSAQTAGTAVDDTMITAKVKAALLAEPGLKSTQIDVATKDATVTLSGTVDSGAMRDRARQIALAIDGVKDVVDNMNLKSVS